MRESSNKDSFYFLEISELILGTEGFFPKEINSSRNL